MDILSICVVDDETHEVKDHQVFINLDKDMFLLCYPHLEEIYNWYENAGDGDTKTFNFHSSNWHCKTESR